jgi:hypothetical protein
MFWMVILKWTLEKEIGCADMNGIALVKGRVH